MNITIQFGWWVAPLAVTAAAFTWALWYRKDEPAMSGSMFSVPEQSGRVFRVPAALILSLIAWLVWALVR